MSNTSRDLLISLSMTFLNHLADVSNNICTKRDKKTIIPEHVFDAMTVSK